MGHADHDTPDRSTSSSTSIIRWRAWPCESCSGQSTALDYLVRSVGSSTEFPDGGRNEQIDWRKSREAALLGEWVVQCPHTEWSGLALPDLAEGSEHLVYFDEASAEVVKVTRPGIYDDYYEIVDGRMKRLEAESRLEVWVGDARSDNFVSVAGSIVPIDNLSGGFLW